MTDSILDSVKQALGVPVDSTDFDPELMMYINSVLSTLNQLGVGPVEGFRITDNTATWVDFLGDNPKLNEAQTYTSFRVKLMFDPPPTSFALDAMKEQIQEASWRLNATREETEWVDPTPVADPDQPYLF